MFRHIPEARRKFYSRIKTFASLLVLVCWLSSASLALAQAWPTLDGVVADDTGQINASEVNQAAQALQALGIRPLAVFSQSGLGYASSGDLAYAAAQNYGLGQSGRVIDPDLFAVVVVLDTRQATILYGDRLKRYMEGNAALATHLREDYLNPSLQDQNYTKAFADTFTQAAREIDLQRNPPPTATPIPSVITNIDTKGLGNSLLIGLGVIIFLVVLAVAGPALWRTWQRNKAAEARRQSLREQLLQARNVAADMITDLDFPDDPQRQIQYRFLALSLEKERPEQLANITAQYEQIYDRLVPALATFNTLNQSTPATEQELTNAIAGYQQVQSEVRYASGFLEWLAEQGRIVEGQIASAPSEVDAAKKALAAATEELTTLAAAAPDLDLPAAGSILTQVSAKLNEADTASNASPPRPLAAYDASVQARSLLDKVMASWRRLSAIYKELVQNREKLAGLRTKGFKLSQVDDPMAASVEQLRKAATSISSNQRNSDELLQKATEIVNATDEQTVRLISLQADNEKALERLKREGDEVKKMIDAGARAFDAVDEYAEESWRDIKGNGTEAQRAADFAFNLWQEASKQNALTPQSPQDFDAARSMIDQASEALAKSRELVAAIVTRLEYIRESQRVAAEEIAAAQKDITGGEAFVARYDTDISPRPSDLLSEAARLLEAARAEMSRPKPNWIEVVALARKANDTADRALADARSEQQAMEARRLKVKTNSQQAAASLSRASNFASVHRADLSPDVFTMLEGAQEGAKRGEEILATAQSRRVEDVELGRALDEAASTLAEAREAADGAFALAESQFRTMEALRTQLNNVFTQADATIASADALIAQNSNSVGREAHELLDQAVSLMPEQVNASDARSLTAAVTAAQQAEQLALQAYNSAQADIDAHNRAAQAQQMQDMLSTLAALGMAAASSGGSRRRSRGGWGGGGGTISIGGGGGWGGGGSSSGGWGGGGSSSGSWGGGGSSGGSWGGGGSSSGGW